MFFYKLQGICDGLANNEDRHAKRELSRKIALDTVEFNSRDSDMYVFVSDIEDNVVTIGLLAKCVVNPIAAIKKYAKFCNMFEPCRHTV